MATIKAESLQANEEECTCLMSKVITGPRGWEWRQHRSCPVTRLSNGGVRIEKEGNISVLDTEDRANLLANL